VSRTTTKIAQIHPSLVRGCREPRGQVQCLVELGPRDGGLLTHVAKDGDLGPGGDQRVGDTIDPDPGTPPVASFFASDPLEREDAVRPRELAEAQSHHAGVRCHVAILALSTDINLAPDETLGGLGLGPQDS
jgi:hypothetical protein